MMLSSILSELRLVGFLCKCQDRFQRAAFVDVSSMLLSNGALCSPQLLPVASMDEDKHNLRVCSEREGTPFDTPLSVHTRKHLPLLLNTACLIPNFWYTQRTTSELFTKTRANLPNLFPVTTLKHSATDLCTSPDSEWKGRLQLSKDST